MWRVGDGSPAAACLLLLFIGIRNAWDIAVWMTVKQQREPH